MLIKLEERRPFKNYLMFDNLKIFYQNLIFVLSFRVIIALSNELIIFNNNLLSDK